MPTQEVLSARRYLLVWFERSEKKISERAEKKLRHFSAVFTAQIFSVIAWRNAVFFAESFGKMAHAFIACAFGDFFTRIVGQAQ